MEKRLQQRLIGAAVIIALAVIFLPMLLNGSGDTGRVSMKMQIPPEPNYSFNGAAQPPAASATAPVAPVAVIPPSTTAAPQAPASAPVPPSAPPPSSPATTPSSAPTPAPQPAAPPQSSPAKVEAAPPPQAPPAAPAIKPKPAATPVPAQNEAATGGKTVTPAWVVQVASLSQESGAKRLRDRLRKEGFAAYVDRFDDKGKVYYRVRVGPKLTRAGAQAQQAKIEQAVKLKGLVVPYR